GPRSWPCIHVPNAPSKTSTRLRRASRKGCWAPLPTGVVVPRGSAIPPGYVAAPTLPVLFAERTGVERVRIIRTQLRVLGCSSARLRLYPPIGDFLVCGEDT